MAQRSRDAAPQDPGVRMRMKELRLERGWSQQQIANVLGVPKWRYQKWEQRGRVHPPRMIMPVCLALGTTPEYLLTGTGVKHPQ